jgi:hypothetical protein
VASSARNPGPWPRPAGAADDAEPCALHPEQGRNLGRGQRRDDHFHECGIVHVFVARNGGHLEFAGLEFPYRCAAGKAVPNTTTVIGR